MQRRRLREPAPTAFCVRGCNDMSWLQPSPGSRLSSSGDASWLQPSPGTHRESQCHDAPSWLHPSLGHSSDQEALPSVHHEARRGMKRGRSVHWLEPAPGKSCQVAHETSPAWLWPSPGSSLGQPGASLDEPSTSSSRTRSIHLDLVSVYMIDSQDPSLSLYQQNGADKQRIRNVLGSGCGACGCLKRLPSQSAIDFCVRFHNLTDEARSHYLHTAYDTCGEELGTAPQGSSSCPNPKHIRTQWHLLGQRVNVKCLGKLLGMGPCSFYKKCKGQVDMRKFPHPRGRNPCPQIMIVDQLFLRIVLLGGRATSRSGCAIAGCRCPHQCQSGICGRHSR